MVQKILIQHSYVAGLQFTEYSLLAKDIEVGDRFSLVREPNNKYDQNAIAVQLSLPGVVKVGYIPKAQNEMLARFLDAGLPVEVVVTEHVLSQPFASRLQIAVFLLWTAPNAS